MKEIQKAIKHFECVRDGAVAVLDSGFGTKPNESDSLYKNRKLYSELAISALEKQIPKKPIINKRKIQCINGHNQPIQQYKYCPMCGQLMDWSAHPTEKGGIE